MLILLFVLYPDIIAQAAGPAQDLVSGIWLWTLLTGKTHPHSEYQRVITKLDAAENELRRRTDQDRETLIPALVRSTDILAKHLERSQNTPPPPAKGAPRR
jgi:hypothetical protein